MANDNIPSFELVFKKCISFWPVKIEGLEVVILERDDSYEVRGVSDIYERVMEDFLSNFKYAEDEDFYLFVHGVIYTILYDLVQISEKVDTTELRAEHVRKVFRNTVVGSFDGKLGCEPNRTSSRNAQIKKMKKFINKNFK